MRANDRRRGEVMIRQAHLMASMTGAAWAGKLGPLSAYLKPDLPRGQASGDVADDEEL